MEYKPNAPPKKDKTRTLSALGAKNNSNDNSSYANSSPTKRLTEKQRALAIALGQGESVRAAAERAGYRGNSATTEACRVKRMPAVKALIASEQAKNALALQMTRQKFMDMLQEAFDMARLMAEPSSMVSAAREIGKACGYYEPQKVQVSVAGAIAVEQMNKMSDAQLLELITKSVEDAAVDDVPLLEALEDRDADES